MKTEIIHNLRELLETHRDESRKLINEVNELREQLK